MISFELAQELKTAGFPPGTSPNAVYCLNDQLRIRRKHALHMWYGSKAKEGVPVDLEQEAVFAPSLSELVIACGRPLLFYEDNLFEKLGLAWLSSARRLRLPRPLACALRPFEVERVRSRAVFS